MSESKLISTEWESFPFAFDFPRFHFYLHDNCDFCERYLTRVPRPLRSVHPMDVTHMQASFIVPVSPISWRRGCLTVL